MQGWEAVRAWRKAQRATLNAGRLAAAREERARRDEAITDRLEPLLSRCGALQRPLAIGVGFEPCRLGTIYPQAHDIPMDLIVTDRRGIPTGDARPRRA
jgi:5-formyltetrahydrofolate cyclo-ligase